MLCHTMLCHGPVLCEGTICAACCVARQAPRDGVTCDGIMARWTDVVQHCARQKLYRSHTNAQTRTRTQTRETRPHLPSESAWEVIRTLLLTIKMCFKSNDISFNLIKRIFPLTLRGPLLAPSAGIPASAMRQRLDSWKCVHSGESWGVIGAWGSIGDARFMGGPGAWGARRGLQGGYI